MKKTKKLLVRFTMIMMMMMTIMMILVMVMVMMVSVIAIDGDINYRMKAANPGWDETACPGAV